MEVFAATARSGIPAEDGNSAGHARAKGAGQFSALLLRELTGAQAPGQPKKAQQFPSDPLLMLLAALLPAGLQTLSMPAAQPHIGSEQTGGAMPPAIGVLPFTNLDWPAMGEESAALMRQLQSAAEGGAELPPLLQTIAQAMTKEPVAAQGNTAALQEIRELFLRRLENLPASLDHADAPVIQDASAQASQANGAQPFPSTRITPDAPVTQDASAQASQTNGAQPFPSTRITPDAPVTQDASAQASQTHGAQPFPGTPETPEEPDPLHAKAEPDSVHTPLSAGPDGVPVSRVQHGAIDQQRPPGQGAEPFKNQDGFAAGETPKQKDEMLPFQAVFQAHHQIAPDLPRGIQNGNHNGAGIEVARPGADAFDRIVQSITALKDSPSGELQIQLKPEFLGKVTIRLAMEEGGLVAKIAAANPRVQDAFLNEAHSLQAALAEQGLKDVRVVVTSSSVQDPTLQQQAGRRGHERPPQKRGRAAAEALQAAGAWAFSAYETLAHAGTVDRLA